MGRYGIFRWAGSGASHSGSGQVPADKARARGGRKMAAGPKCSIGKLPAILVGPLCATCGLDYYLAGGLILDPNWGGRRG